MIVWLAGWPHCGSTLLRTYLKDVFGIQSYSVYPESKLDFLFGEHTGLFGRRWGAEFYARYQQCKEAIFIKTHEFPIDNAPAIYISRDGRDAVPSLARFWQMPHRDVILGRNSLLDSTVFGTWSSHYYAWDPKCRPHTAFVNFNEILATPDVVTARLSHFLQLQPTGKFTDRFEENRHKYPQLYDDKNDELRNTITGADLRLFWRVNGQVMKELGYVNSIPTEKQPLCQDDTPSSSDVSSPSTPIT